MLFNVWFFGLQQTCFIIAYFSVAVICASVAFALPAAAAHSSGTIGVGGGRGGSGGTGGSGDGGAGGCGGPLPSVPEMQFALWLVVAQLFFM